MESKGQIQEMLKRYSVSSDNNLLHANMDEIGSVRRGEVENELQILA